MSDEQWYELCIDRNIPFMFAHKNFRREFYELEYELSNIRDEMVKFLRIDVLANYLVRLFERKEFK